MTAKLAHPQNPERHLDLELLVDTGATWTLLPEDGVEALGLSPSRERGVTLANGERVTYRAGEVVITLNDEDLTTLYRAASHSWARSRSSKAASRRIPYDTSSFPWAVSWRRSDPWPAS